MAPGPHPGRGFPPGFVADRLDEALALRGPVPVYGLVGLQGCGKSTLALQMATLGAKRGLAVAVLSIDDFYLGRRARQALGRRSHPLLAERGPPGTHELPLALATLDALRAGEAAPLPRFDKRSDTRVPPSRWPRLAGPARLVVFEGWFLKTPPEPEEALDEAINELERDEDPDGTWRRHCNRALAGYAALWQRLDWLGWLRGPGFECVPEWRWEQEQRLQRRNGRGGMTRARLERFVQRFERISRQAQRTLPVVADATWPLDANRVPLS